MRKPKAKVQSNPPLKSQNKQNNNIRNDKATRKLGKN